MKGVTRGREKVSQKLCDVINGLPNVFYLFQCLKILQFGDASKNKIQGWINLGRPNLNLA